ncbi:Trp biosynthesis-associated membrane protein [Pseudarthrobacter sp. J75]|uniref:Trp biosynthesis-associated membrane protein n=1 Tax=unclassified Pseudarthrobacter TaxID=2647000 RepID=UPI002E80FAD5|nr:MULTISPECIES: Trp biosynthesis-associated membrane protein [unclassified Pseudarthrobacter]MEE2522650.1 Trp biosynthesis-associated membrane protein [Pseudarthrobacter sp. J47]MEE2529511.1 Trp biosynthesis-associated membrane protein [Pseudarthrobacter sp. J75]MEE2569721.1 Trp biosynthesis-associated membrane protein [Pseudarthrobacter sp. J64]
MPGTGSGIAPVTPRWARRPLLVLAITVLALAAFGTTTQTWLTVHLDPGQLGQGSGSELAVPGNKAATAVTALALVALAGGIAASIAGRVARWVIMILIVLGAAGIVAAAATVTADPLAAAQGAIAEATGVSGGPADVATTVFPVLSMMAGVLLGCVALLLVPAGRYWKTRTRFDAKATPGAAASGPVDEIDTWDRLSRGDDPT